MKRGSRQQGKGARRVADIPPEVLEGLNNGTLVSANLTEWLAVDASKLLAAVLPEFKLASQRGELSTVARDAQKLGVMGRTERIAAALVVAGVDLESLSQHRSSTVRCWGAFVAARHQL